MRTWRNAALVAAVLATTIGCAQQPANLDGVDNSQSITLSSPSVALAHHHDASPPLMLMQPAERRARAEHEVKPVPRGPRGNYVAQPNAAVQTTIPSLMMPAVIATFDGVGNGLTGPAGTFTVASAPPDTNGDIGPNHYVQTVNTDFAIFSKTGTVLYGPVAINTLWSGFGGGCQANNDGDPVVLYDPIADRWIISQFSVTTTPYLECVAVSQTADPTGAYYRYSFDYGTTDFNDYPKMGVWPDAYYTTFNIFANAASFSGAKVCAYDRARMLTGAAATQQCFSTNTSWGGLLPADLDGARLPPAGSPNYVVGLGTNNLGIWKFHVDWATPANSTFTGPSTVAVAAFTEACNGGTCIPQAGTTQQLDSLADRLMYRFAYRNFGDHEAMVVSHSVSAGSSTGVRWYELRPSGGNVTLFQQGTYAPDANYRWMPSMAMDRNGNMALGFSLSGSTLHPEIHYTGRLVTDAAGTMGQGENTIIDGAGSQSGTRGLTRWGDYAMMGVDPTDDCTFWYTTEYLPATGEFNWKTRIGSFKFPGCGTAAGNDFSIGATPSSATVQRGSSATFTVTTAVTSGSAQSVALSASGLPAGATASFNPASVTAGGSSTLTISTATTTAAGTSAVTITGAGSSATHTASVSLTVTAPGTNDFSIAASPSSVSVAQGASGTSTVSTATTSGGAQSVALSASGLPSGATASFSPASVSSGASSTLTLAAGSATPAGTYAVTITGAGASATHTATVSLTVTSSGGGGSGLVNGGFETGSLSGWISAGSTGVSTTAHTGTYSARVGSTSPFNGDSSIAQTFTAPAAGGTLSFFYEVHCPDTVTYDWATATLKDNTAGTTTTMLSKTCTNAGAWVKASAALTAGHSYTLTLLDHDDNYAGDPTYTLFDDVAISAGSTGGGLVNGGFETGSLSGWTASGSTAVSTASHSGVYAAQVGSTSAFNGDSSIAQTFTAPSGSTTVTFWYSNHCTDTVAYDWATATLKDNTAGTSTTVLPQTCAGSAAWTQVNAAVTAGHSYTLTLTDHDDGYSTDPTYTLFDDVAVH